MTGFEWFLLIVVVIAVPLIVAVVVTMWTLEQARQRNRKNRTGGTAEPVKRMAVRRVSNDQLVVDDAASGTGSVPEAVER